ncbi:MAG: hypothetical protein AAGC46_10470 [Solirubrobacteraceae bacterium]|nr:hypothetical protein [Patulibacter sp.]
MHRPTYAEITSSLALFIALGGVSWAATTLPKGSVTSAAIRDGGVGSADLAGGAVTASKLSKDLRTQLGVTVGKGSDGTKGADGVSGSDGKNGAPGPAGAPGTPGAPGRDGAALVASHSFGGLSVSSTKYVKVGSMDWAQPANSLQDVRGVYQVKAAGCPGGQGGLAYQLVVDGQEISYDIGNTGVNSSANSWNPEAEILPPWGGSNQMPTDRGSIGGEIPLVTGAAGTTHHLDLYMRSDFCGTVGFNSLDMYVTQYVAG